MGKTTSKEFSTPRITDCLLDRFAGQELAGPMGLYQAAASKIQEIKDQMQDLGQDPAQRAP
jgi:hypothetical protein